MSKAQFWILNLIGGVCAALLLCNMILARANERLNRSLVQTQAHLARAQELQNTAQNLIVRTAQRAQTDEALAALLGRHEFQVTLNTNAPGSNP